MVLCSLPHVERIMSGSSLFSAMSVSFVSSPFVAPPPSTPSHSLHVLFSSIYCPVFPSIIYPLLVLCFPHSTALSPAIFFFWEPAACQLPVTSGAWLSTSLYSGRILPHCLGEEPSVSGDGTGREGPPGLGGSLLGNSSRTWSENERWG